MLSRAKEHFDAIGNYYHIRGDIALVIVQNAESLGVSEGKTRSIRGSYAPKKHFYGCDCSSWVYAGWHCDDITDTAVTFT